jgi:hypothetical protein
MKRDKKKETSQELSERFCYHPQLKPGKVVGEKICTTCGRLIYYSHKEQAELSKA